MLSTTIPAYPYKEYADDDDIQAFFAAYNAATQNIVSWLATANLPYYPGLSGPLLQWVASGLYGTEKTSLAQTQTPARGLLNTDPLDSDPLNSFTPATTTYFDISDDVFKRILTWNLYKADGKRFTMKWLKRRIMRFLVGTNGLDPDPLSPGFVVGPENTQAVSVTVVNDVLTVTINGAYISSLVQLQPNILEIFKAAFLGGVLDLPAQYTYAVNIVTTLTVTAEPTTVSAIGIATTLTTGTVSVSALGGNGAYTVSWAFQSGGTGITINSPTQFATSFTASGMARGTTLSGLAICTVTDSAGHQASAVVSVTIKNVSIPTVTLSPASLSVTGASSTETTTNITATINGGAGPYQTLYSFQSGGAGMYIGTPTGLSTTITATGLSPGTTDSATLLFTVTDAYGQQATATAPVSISRVTQLSLTANPTSLSASSQATPITTGSTTIGVSGGQPPYSFAWDFGWTSNSDGAVITIGSPYGATTDFTASGMTAGNTDTGFGHCLVTDAYGQQVAADVDVSFTYNPPSPVTHTYTSGSGTETAPFSGFVVIETVSGGGGGVGGYYDPTTRTRDYGSGGDSGTYCRSQYAVTAGQTLQYVVGAGGTGGAGGDYGAPGAGGTSSVSSGSLSITTMTAPGGNTGNAPSGGNQANTTFNTGGIPAGGAAQTGEYISATGAGGSGGYGTLSGSPGGAGVVSFHYYAG